MASSAMDQPLGHEHRPAPRRLRAWLRKLTGAWAGADSRRRRAWLALGRMFKLVVLLALIVVALTSTTVLDRPSQVFLLKAFLVCFLSLLAGWLAVLGMVEGSGRAGPRSSTQYLPQEIRSGVREVGGSPVAAPARPRRRRHRRHDRTAVRAHPRGRVLAGDHGDRAAVRGLDHRRGARAVPRRAAARRPGADRAAEDAGPGTAVRLHRLLRVHHAEPGAAVFPGRPQDPRLSQRHRPGDPGRGADHRDPSPLVDLAAARRDGAGLRLLP